MRTTVIIACCLAIGATSTGGADPNTEDISCTIAGGTLSEAVSQLASLSGARLRTGPRVSGHRVFLYVQGRSLDEIRREVAADIPGLPGKSVWYRMGESLVLEEDIASYEARERAARTIQQKRYRERAENLARFEAWTASIRDEDDRATRNTKKGLRKYLQIFRALPPRQQKMALHGRPVEVPFGQISSTGQSLVRAEVFNHGRTSSGVQWHGSRDYESVRVAIMPTGPLDRPRLRETLMFGDSGGGLTLLDMLRPPVRHDQDGGYTYHGDRSAEDRARVRGPANRATIPALQRLIAIEDSPGWNIERALLEVSSRSQLPLLGGYDPCFRKRGASPMMIARPCWGRRPEKMPRQVPIWQVLDHIAQEFDLDWDFRRGWIRIRSPRTVLAWGGEVDVSPPTPEELRSLGENSQYGKPVPPLGGAR